MSTTVLIDYGCHFFTYRLATHLGDLGYSIRYYANGSLESPNLSSLTEWVRTRPNVVRSIKCKKPYGKLNLHQRLLGEIEWSKQCIRALECEDLSAVVVSCVPLAAVSRIQKWARRRGVPLIYWLQDLQGRATRELLGRKMGLPGRMLGLLACRWEQRILEKSRMVITIANGHERELPPSVQSTHRYVLLENWANIEEFPQFPADNHWSRAHGLDKTLNAVYSGTLGLKHDLGTFISLASHFRDRPDVRVVVVSSGHASEVLRAQAKAKGLSNLVILPFQPYRDVPKVLASAAVLIAPLEASAGSFCVPSKVLSYLCAGRPTVIAIDSSNPAATTLQHAGAGSVVRPGDSKGFIDAVAAYFDDSSVRQSAGLKARLYAEQTFGLGQVTQKFLSILSSSNIAFGADSQWANAAGKSAAAIV